MKDKPMKMFVVAAVIHTTEGVDKRDLEDIIDNALGDHRKLIQSWEVNITPRVMEKFEDQDSNELIKETRYRDGRYGTTALILNNHPTILPIGSAITIDGRIYTIKKYATEFESRVPTSDTANRKMITHEVLHITIE